MGCHAAGGLQRHPRWQTFWVDHLGFITNSIVAILLNEKIYIERDILS